MAIRRVGKQEAIDLVRRDTPNGIAKLQRFFLFFALQTSSLVRAAMSKKRFVSWAAVSSLPQAQKISLDDQLAVNRQHIEKHDGILIAELVVPGESRDIVLFEEAAAKMDAYAQLKALLDAKAFDVLICLNRSRLGRTLALAETVAELCRRAGVFVYETESPPASLDPQGGFDQLLLGAVKSAMAQREIEEIRRRHEMGMRGRFKKGEFLSRVPFGWRAVYAPDGERRIEIDPDAARLIRYALVELYLEQGRSIIAIADELNRSTIVASPNGLPWSYHTVRGLFRMLWRYAGYGEINKRSQTGRPYARSRGQWPAILTESEVHRIEAERRVRAGARGATWKGYRFSLMVWCATCGQRMTMNMNTTVQPRKRDGTIARYRILYATCRGPGPHRNRCVRIEHVHKAVRVAIEYIQDRRNWPAILESNHNDTTPIEREIAVINEQINQAKASILAADDKLIDGTFDAERHARQVRRLKERIEHLQHELTILNERLAQVQYAGQRESRLAELAELGLRCLEMEDAKAANARLRSLLRVWVADGKVVEIEYL